MSIHTSVHIARPCTGYAGASSRIKMCATTDTVTWTVPCTAKYIVTTHGAVHNSMPMPVVLSPILCNVHATYTRHTCTIHTTYHVTHMQCTCVRHTCNRQACARTSNADANRIAHAHATQHFQNMQHNIIEHATQHNRTYNITL